MTQQAELHKKIDKLPPEYIGEVIDFVGYLQQKVVQSSQIDKQHEEQQLEESMPPLPKLSLGQQFAGALRLSNTAYEAMQNSLQEGRSEWNRDIF